MTTIDRFGFAQDSPIERPECVLDPAVYEARLATIRDYYKDDHYATIATGIAIDDALPGWAQVSAPIVRGILNAKGGVMGGALYTLGDYASAVADYEEGYINMGVDSHMQFVHLAKGERLIATAIATYRSRQLGFYRVRVEDDLGTLVAVGSFTGMRKPKEELQP